MHMLKGTMRRSKPFKNHYDFTGCEITMICITWFTSPVYVAKWRLNMQAELEKPRILVGLESTKAVGTVRIQGYHEPRDDEGVGVVHQIILPKNQP